MEKRLAATYAVPKAFISAFFWIFCFCLLYQLSEFYFYFLDKNDTRQ